MKLWVFSAIWARLNNYWASLVHHNAPQSPTASIQQIVSQTSKTSVKVSSPQVKSKVYKLNISELSEGSFKPNSHSRYRKNKKIMKEAKEKVKAHSKYPIIGNQEANKFRNIFDSLTDDISPIEDKDSEDSAQTVRQYLVSLEPACQVHRIEFDREKYQKRLNRQKMLARELFGHRIKGKIVCTADQLPKSMKRFATKSPPIFEASKEQSRAQVVSKSIES